MTEQEILKQLEKRITKEYKDTEAVIREKIAYFTKDFDKENKKYQQMVKDGLISKSDYKNWYKDQMFAKKWSNKMVSEISSDLVKTTETASKIINNDTSKVYLQGLQEGVKELEPYDDFTVFDTRQIKKIADENAKHLPKANPNIPKEERWNEKRIKSALMQSAIKGESVQKLAGRLRVVVGMGRTSAIRNARTMMTSSHNMGKLDLGKEAVNMGLDVRKKWIAIFDNRTRDSHASLHGEVVDMDEEFTNGLMFPADPDGDPAEVYNCRCNMVITHDPKRSGMSKEEFEQNVTENMARKEEFREANRQLKSRDVLDEPKTVETQSGENVNVYNSTKVDHQIDETPAFNEYDYWSDKQESYRLQSIQRDTGLGEEESKDILYALCGNKDDYHGIGDVPECWFYGADTKIRNMESEKYIKYAETIDKYVVSAPKYEGTIYRGLALDESVLSTLQEGMVFEEKGALSSWTSKADVAEMFGRGRSEEMGLIPVIIKTENHKYATPVSHLSVFGTEESEVLVSNLHDIEYSISSITKDQGVEVITLKWEEKNAS